MMTKQQLTPRRAVPRGRRERRGMTILYLLVILSVIFALASFAVDYGRVQLSKTQLQISADAAAKWAAMGLRGGKANVVARANEAAADNPVNGVTPTFAAADVQVGRWNAQTRVFTNEGKPYNAVKLTAAQVIPLVLGNVVQKPSVTVRVSAVARAASMGGVIGLNGITFHNNAFIGSYDSSVTTSPTQANANSNGQVFSNGAIEGKNNGTILGDISYGPDGTVIADSWTVSGSTTELDDDVVAPAMPAWNPSSNPGSIPNGDYVHPGGTLNGGTYWFNSLTLTGPLTFNGPATIHVNGDVMIDGTNSDITAYDSKPANLTIYQIGTGRKFTSKNQFAMKAVVIAPGSAFEAMNRFDFYGMVLFETITLKNTAQFFFDETSALHQTAALVD